jgi:NAD+ diphosphatase
MTMQRPFTGMRLDRASTERKDPDQIADLLADPAASSLLAGPDEVVVAGAGEGGALLRARAVPPSSTEAILLGLDEDRRPVFAIDLAPLAPDARAEMLDGGQLVSLRDAGAQLPHAEAGLAAYVTGMLNWHRRHRFCANCGNETEIAEAGYSRRCPRCGAHHFPRTDPVVIMTVEHDGALLLGRRAGWPRGRCSVLAGFVSPGESAEEAVVREVQEESGIVARDPVFVSSQPWPFPSSLMLGFDAVSDGGSPVATDGELEEVAWWALDAVRAAIRGENPDLLLPPSISIARFLIERWVAAHDQVSPEDRLQRQRRP